MKKVLSLFAASLLFMSMLSSSNVNEVLIEEVELIKVDCYEQAFDTMEAFADAGFSEEVVAFWEKWPIAGVNLIAMMKMIINFYL